MRLRIQTKEGFLGGSVVKLELGHRAVRNHWRLAGIINLRNTAQGRQDSTESRRGPESIIAAPFPSLGLNFPIS